MCTKTTTIDDYEMHPKLRWSIGIMLLVYVLILIASFFIDISDSFLRFISFIAFILVVPEVSLKANIWVRKKL